MKQLIIFNISNIEVIYTQSVLDIENNKTMNVPVVKIRETMVDGIVAWSCVFIVFKPVGEDLPFSM